MKRGKSTTFSSDATNDAVSTLTQYAEFRTLESQKTPLVTIESCNELSSLDQTRLSTNLKIPLLKSDIRSQRSGRSYTSNSPNGKSTCTLIYSGSNMGNTISPVSSPVSSLSRLGVISTPRARKSIQVDYKKMLDECRVTCNVGYVTDSEYRLPFQMKSNGSSSSYYAKNSTSQFSPRTAPSPHTEHTQDLLHPNILSPTSTGARHSNSLKSKDVAFPVHCSDISSPKSNGVPDSPDVSYSLTPKSLRTVSSRISAPGLYRSDLPATTVESAKRRTKSVVASVPLSDRFPRIRTSTMKQEASILKHRVSQLMGTNSADSLFSTNFTSK